MISVIHLRALINYQVGALFFYSCRCVQDFLNLLNTLNHTLFGHSIQTQALKLIIMENTGMTSEIVYFSGNVGGRDCIITSKLWSFGAHHIPFNAISDVVATRKTHTAAILFCSLLFGVGIILVVLETMTLGVSLFIAGLVGLLIVLLSIKEGLFIYSSSGQYELISDRGGEDYNKMYSAMINCLKGRGVPEDDTIICPECGKEVSKKAEKCPNCGCPAEMFNKE